MKILEYLLSITWLKLKLKNVCVFCKFFVTLDKKRYQKFLDSNIRYEDDYDLIRHKLNYKENSICAAQFAYGVLRQLLL